MLVPVSWLKDYVDTDATPEQLAEILSLTAFPVEQVFPQGGDWVLDVEVTSNRGDCQCIVGLAREIAAATGKKLRFENEFPEEAGDDASSLARLDVQDDEYCPRYIARLIRGVKVGPSPDWLVRRLASMGLQPRNNVVDITNFILFELNHPLHAFDHDKLAEGRIVVRRATNGEPFTPLYGDAPKLTGEDLVIADAERPMALAGVIGGMGTEVDEGTTNILLEAAVFDPVSVRRTSRRHGIATDSSFRFERGVDPIMLDVASLRAAALIAEMAGGTVCPGTLDSNPEPPAGPVVGLRHARIRRVLGYDVPAEEVARILKALGFEAAGEDGQWRVPTWRLRDVTREIDLIEEVARVYGYDKIPETVSLTARVPDRNPRAELKNAIRSALTAGGCCEAVTDSLVDPDAHAHFNVWEASGALALGASAMRSDHSTLRTSLLPGLLDVKLRNQEEADRRAVQFFEIGPVYLPQGEDELPEERLCLAILDDGLFTLDGRLVEDGFARMKGAVEATLAAAGLPAAAWTPAGADDAWAAGFDPETACSIHLNGARIGAAGRPAVRRWVKEFQLVPAIAEISLDALLALEPGKETFTPLPRFPAVKRDVALVVDEAVTWGRIRAAGDEKRPERLIDLSLIDLFRGKQLGAKKKSLAFRLVYRDPNRTLTDEEVNAANAALVAHLCATLDAVQRGA